MCRHLSNGAESCEGSQQVCNPGSWFSALSCVLWMLPNCDTGQGGWGVRGSMSCVLILCHTHCLNFVLNSGHQSRAFPLGEVPFGPFVSFPVSWVIVRAHGFYSSALGREVWLWSLPFQKGFFANFFSSSPGFPALGLYRQRCRECGALMRP